MHVGQKNPHEYSKIYPLVIQGSERENPPIFKNLKAISSKSIYKWAIFHGYVK